MSNKLTAAQKIALRHYFIDWLNGEEFHYIINHIDTCCEKRPLFNEFDDKSLRALILDLIFDIEQIIYLESVRGQITCSN